jgi:prepilin-type N-terminal cleavage/methylation domain-containing protein
MCLAANRELSRRERCLAVRWQDCAWHPRIAVQFPSVLRWRSAAVGAPAWLPLWPHSRRRLSFFKPMKNILFQPRRHRAGFTIVELLTVIAIIGILAAMLLPALSIAKKHAQKVQAQLQISNLAGAIQHYDSTYGRFPVSTNAQAAAAGGDFTYGGIFPTPTAGANWPGMIPGNYWATNADVIAILMNLTNYPNGTGPTVNNNYVKNPQQIVFLSAKMVDDPTLPGVGPDLVYRDPWGNPYVISMDLNYDEMCRDAFYRSTNVSNGGLNGLIDPDNTPDNFQYHGKVMVWSAGPDKMVDPTSPANLGANRDNVLSWQ